MPQKDLIGKQFGRLTVIEKAPDIIGKNKKYTAWKCLCNCGNNKIAATYHLNRGSVSSCGCLLSQYGKILKPGMKINRLTTISYNKGKWLCQCDCGKMTTLKTALIINGNSKSCGCYNLELCKERAYILSDAKREYEPRIASARRVWKGYFYRDADCLSFEDFLMLSQQNCFYCGIIPQTEHNQFLHTTIPSGKKAIEDGLFTYNGLDRVNNSITAHTLENCVPACIFCNRAKSNRDVNDFLSWGLKLQTKSFDPVKIIPLVLPENASAKSTIKVVFKGYSKDTNMTIEEFYFLSQQPCFYCNGSYSNSFTHALSSTRSSQQYKDNGWFHYNGLDRVYNTNHNKDSVVPCCYDCNWAKGKLSLSDFYSWITRFQAFQQSK